MDGAKLPESIQIIQLKGFEMESFKSAINGGIAKNCSHAYGPTEFPLGTCLGSGYRKDRRKFYRLVDLSHDWIYAGCPAYRL